MTKILIEEAALKLAFERWWYDEGSSAPKPNDDMYEHCKQMCEIAWSNGAYKALEQPAQQEPAIPKGWKLEKVGPDVRLTSPDGDAWRFRETDGVDFFVFNFLSAMLNAAPPAPAQEPDPDELTIAYMSGLYDGKKRKPLTDEQIDLLINGRGDEDDDDYVEPTGDGFGLTDADLVRLVRRVEAAHGITKGKP